LVEGSRSPPRRPRPPGTPASGRLRGDPRSDGRAARRRPPPRSASPRVPPQPDGTGARDPATGVGRPLGRRPPAHVVGGRPVGGRQPHAGPPRRAPGADVP